MTRALVIGAGPAGLMAAEELTKAGHKVIVADAMPTPARKFLMAGKSGLNLTKSEPADTFWQKLSFGADAPDALRHLDFGPEQVIDWAEGLGIPLFTGSTGRVFPVGMKASPVLRAWLARMNAAGMELRPRWRWTGIDQGFHFQTPEGNQVLHPEVTVLALGGASWPRLGSDAGWISILQGAGVSMTPFQPANMGFRAEWSDPMRRFIGQAVKGTALRAGQQQSRGEWVISAQGIEGGGLYEIAQSLREGSQGWVDLAPDLDHATLAARFARPKAKLSLGNWLRRILNDPIKVALLMEWGRPLPDSADAWANRVKALPLRHAGPMDIATAISSAGGVAWSAVADDLQLRAYPGVFLAGEMLDWEAPTGGYLLTACLAQGRIAGRAAATSLRD